MLKHNKLIRKIKINLNKDWSEIHDEWQSADLDSSVDGFNSFLESVEKELSNYSFVESVKEKNVDGQEVGLPNWR